VVREAVHRLGSLHAKDRPRWQELLEALLTWSYAHRPRAEHAMIQTVAEEVLTDSSQRREVHKMGQMIGIPWGEELLIEGEVRGLRKVLQQLLKDRFKKVPKALKERIEASTDNSRLERAIRQVYRLERLEDIQL
jgi:hypothetical protein